MPVSAWQGIRGANTSGQYLISGTSNRNGLLFVGSIKGVGKSYSVNYPGARAPVFTDRTILAAIASGWSAVTGTY